MEKWYSLFNNYQIRVKEINFDSGANPYSWFEENIKYFDKLFTRMADEVFYILFSNRQFLLSFNDTIINTVLSVEFPKDKLTRKGTIKRARIPKWVNEAVFYRDKGKCVFCLKDLTGLISTLTKSNYDHIVPLDLYGTNDPCNIQLTCETCNKKKNSKEGITSNLYTPWW